MMDRPALVCFRCGKTPAEMPVYEEMAQEYGVTAEDYVWAEEGTLNEANGHFCCDDCYIDLGLPVNSDGSRWRAP